MGDMPIYVGQDSVDVWSNQPFFMLDDRGLPTRVAGVPPDAYSDTGQRWGNPYLTGLRWLRTVTSGGLSVSVALLTIAMHFESITSSLLHDTGQLMPRRNRSGGHWVNPGRAVFDAIRAELGRLPLVAEDLGSVDQTTIDLRTA